MTSDSGTRKFILNTPSHGLEFFVPVWSCERKNFQSRHSKYVYTVKSTVILYKKDCFFFFLLDTIDFLNLFLFIFFQEKNLEIIKKATSPVIQSVFLVFWILRIWAGGKKWVSGHLPIIHFES